VLIVLEGMNNVGKSTLAEYIRDTYNLPMFHHAGPTEEEAYHVKRHLERWGDSPDCAVFDRFYHTYIAYPVNGNWRWGRDYPPSITPDFRQWAEAEQRDLIARGQMLLIHAHPPFERVFKYEVDLNPAVEPARQDFVDLYEAFMTIFSDWPVIRYDFTDPASVQSTHEAVAKFLA
jgi:hypothetical protein